MQERHTKAIFKTLKVCLYSAIALLLGTLPAQAQVVQLAFGSLPSAQGWQYTTSGLAESSIFSVDGTALHQNSIGTGLGPGGTAFAYYVLNSAVDPTRPFTLDVRARVIQSERLDSGGFAFGALTGSEAFEIFMDTTTIQDASQTTIASLDNTVFHDYRLQVTPGFGYKFFIDGTYVATGPSAANPSSNQLFIGDATSGGNARADITSYVFSQPIPYSVCLLYDPTKAVHSGATQPIKLQLCDATGADLSSSSITLNAISITQVSNSISGPVEDSGNANPDSNFRFDSALGTTGGYIFNLSTKGLATGSYMLNFTVTGAATIFSVPFQVKS